MKTINIILGIIILMISSNNVSAGIVLVDFNSATSVEKGEIVPGGEFDFYEEDGFELFTTSNGGYTQIGQVLINDGFTTSLAAQSDFGFDDRDILIYNILGNNFDFLSIEIYEAASYHPVGNLLVEGIRSGVVVASQMFTTDGIAGAQSFTLNGFTNIDEVRLGGGSSSELVGVDNLTFNIIPEPTTILLLGFGCLLLKKRN